MQDIARAAGQPKTFVLDTNVVLHDGECLGRFEENDVVIPITVLEELDRFKRGGEDIHYQARSFLRRLDALTGDVLSPQGAALGEGLGSVRVILHSAWCEDVRNAFAQDSADHRILNTAVFLSRQAGARPLVLISKDTNLRMKAKSLGLVAQDYTADKVKSFDALYTGKRRLDVVASDVIEEFYAEGGTVPATRLPEIASPIANENFILRNGSKSVLATYRHEAQAFVRVPKLSAFGITPRNAEQSFALRALTDDSIKLVTLLGTAGTGKTLLALAAALECSDRYRQILLARPVVPLSNRDLGYLPGDIGAKLDPYMQPLYDNLAVIRGQNGSNSEATRRILKMQEADRLVITPLTYIRGRSLQAAYFIVDEAQNLTPHEVKTIITRAGEGTKIVLTGDIHQIDQPYLDALSNGLSYLVHRMVGQALFCHVTLEKGERSALADLAGALL